MPLKSTKDSLIVILVVFPLAGGGNKGSGWKRVGDGSLPDP